MEDENSVNINTLIQSNKFLDRLYRVRDQIDLVVDANNYSLKRQMMFCFLSQIFSGCMMNFSHSQWKMKS